MLEPSYSGSQISPPGIRKGRRKAAFRVQSHSSVIQADPPIQKCVEHGRVKRFDEAQHRAEASA